MTEPVSWLVELDVKPGMDVAFRELTVEMVEATRCEPGALTYERFVGDGGVAHLYERFVDSEAALSHLRAFQEGFADRFLALVERRRTVVYGEVTPALRRVLDGLHPTYLVRLDGFAR